MKENSAMIKKYTFGTPIQTESVVVPFETEAGTPAYGTISTVNGFTYTYSMEDEDIIYGLGEANRGINKRGFIYTSNCSDDPNHLEETRSLYGAHNFIIISGAATFGIYVDYPSALTFDIGYTRINELVITCERANLDFYLPEGESAYDIVRQFRKIIGRSYIPPRFAFGFGQSRWGYRTKEDFRTVAKGYRDNHIPIDMIYMDIDYMDSYKDFTVSDEFSDFPAFVEDMKNMNIHLIPIIDAGVKIEPGYDVYEEGVANNYFCKQEDGSDFTAAVWPGYTHFPDVLNPEVRQWFGSKYQWLTNQGIEGFWNDMNEPALFYTPEGISRIQEAMEKFKEQPVTVDAVWGLRDQLNELANHPEDYASFYHTINGQKICHNEVHNLYGFNMTRAAGEALEKISPNRRYLLFSRSSYIGMHRYGGIWTGDNKSWWSHLLLNLKMLPSLNMCGFLYVGADLGGFGADTSRELLLRWLALGVFTPLMRNHAALGTREQECYQFEHIEDFRHIIGVRYRLIPYLYSEYMKAALTDDMYFKPLAFEYPEDAFAATVEDQLLLGNEIMIAPVYTQNAKGRYVYLPEEMMSVQFLPDGTIQSEILPKGHHYIDVPLNVVGLFIRAGKCIPLADAAESVAELDTEHLQFIGYENASYDMYEDDGYTRDYKSTSTLRSGR
jgi:alpha-glucosidase